MYSDESVFRLVDLVYSAACNPAEWTRLLHALCDQVGATGADVAMFGLEQPDARFHAAVGIFGVAEFQKEYLAHYMQCDPYVEAAKRMGFFRTGNIGIGETIMPMSRLNKTEFYNDFGRRYEYVGGLAAIIVASPSHSSAIGLCRPLSREFGEADVRLIGTLLPHLRRALQVHKRLAGAEVRDSALSSTLDSLGTGAILVDGSGRVLFANRSARETLEAQDGLKCDRGSLRADRPHDNRLLLKAIADAAAASAGDRMLTGGTITVDRPSGSRSLHLIVAPLPSREHVVIPDHPGAMILVLDPERRSEPDLALMGRVYGFSRAEAAVAALLLQDLRLEEIADRLHVSVNTVRFHLKHLLAKTDTHRQSTLVRLLSMTSQIQRLRGKGASRTDA